MLHRALIDLDQYKLRGMRHAAEKRAQLLQSDTLVALLNQFLH